MALFAKKWIFSFLVSLAATFAVGFFVLPAGRQVWSVFVSPHKNILSPENFQASLTSNQIIEPAPVLDLEQENASDSYEPESQDQTVGPVESFQDQLDDIQEKLDIISQQVNDLLAQNPKSGVPRGSQNPKQDESSNNQKDVNNEPDQSKQQDQQNNPAAENNLSTETAQNESVAQESCVGQVSINTASEQDLEKITGVGPALAQKIIEARPFYSLDDLLKISGIGEITLQKTKDQGCAYVESGIYSPAVASAGGGGGSAPIVYSKILISEMQILPVAERFVELYNPNSTDVDLTGWYLQRKTKSAAVSDSWNSFVSSSKFQGKTIPANSYFLISREITDSDILLDITLSDDNSLAFKNPAGDISDELGWGQAPNYETNSTANPDAGKSIGRKANELDTDDNSTDFEVDAPSPKAENIKWSEPPAPTLVSIAVTTPPDKLNYNVGENLDITGLVVTGTYSDESTQIETITLENITGFYSSLPVEAQVLAITAGEQTTTYTISISEAPEDIIPPSILSYILQVSGQDPTEENNVTINSGNGVKIKVEVDELSRFEIWINGKRYWYTTTFVTSILRPSSGCSYWPATKNSCSGDVLPDGVYPIDLKITDEAGNATENTSKTIIIDNSLDLGGGIDLIDTTTPSDSPP